MGNPAGVKRDFAGLERRRMAAAKLLQQGVSQAEVARRLGVHRQSVIRWVRELRKSGRAGLKQAGRAGRKAKLSATDLQAIEQALKRGPQALGYETALWTCTTPHACPSRSRPLLLAPSPASLDMYLYYAILNKIPRPLASKMGQPALSEDPSP